MYKGDYILGVLGLGTDLKISLTEWLAFRGTLGGIALSGISVNALLTYGATVGYGFTGGLIFRVFRSQGLQLALSADINQDNQLVILPGKDSDCSLQGGSHARSFI